MALAAHPQGLGPALVDSHSTRCSGCSVESMGAGTVPPAAWIVHARFILQAFGNLLYNPGMIPFSPVQSLAAPDFIESKKTVDRVQTVAMAVLSTRVLFANGADMALAGVCDRVDAASRTVRLSTAMVHTRIATLHGCVVNALRGG